VYAVAKFDVTNELSGIKVPTLIVAGSLDQGTTVRHMATIQKHIANSELKIVNGGSHALTVEFPERFCDLIEPFIIKY